MEQVTTPGHDLWQAVADTTGWVKLTRPADFDVPAPLALQIAERWVKGWINEHKRNRRTAYGVIHSHVQSDDELYLFIGLVGQGTSEDRLKALATRQKPAESDEA